MDFSLITQLIQQLGMPIAALIGIGWFFAFRIWPWLTEYLASRSKAESEDRIAIATSLTNQSELIFSLVKAVTELRSTLSEMTSSLHRMNDEISDIRLDIAALYADRQRPSRGQKHDQPPKKDSSDEQVR